MTQYERSGQPWRDDPATTLVDELYQEISEELGTDGPVATFGHGDLHHLGHLVGDEGSPESSDSSDVLAHDSCDTEDLAAEELAMHYLEDGEFGGELPGYLRDESNGGLAQLDDPDDDEVGSPS